jgi:DNA end-binding protein Ku
MTALRSSWKGFIQFSMVTIPVRLYHAVDSGSNIRFNMLHKDCHGRVGNEKVCKSCGDSLSADHICKGYEHAKDEYVIVSADDLAQVKLKSTKTIEIVAFVDEDEVDTKLYDTPFYVGPDGDVGGKVFALMAQALTDTGKLGVGKVVLRDREDMVLVGAKDNRLVVYKIRFPQFIRNAADVPGQTDAVVNDDELKLATNLIESMSKPLEEVEMRDTYHEAVRSMIEAKIDGTESIMPTEIASEESELDIMTALRNSIDAAKSKPMVKSPAKKKAAAKKKAPAKKKAAKRRKAA